MVTDRSITARRLLVATIGLVGLVSVVVMMIAVSRSGDSPRRTAPSVIRPEYVPTGFYTAALQKTTDTTPAPASIIRGLVVNHHLLAAQFIVDTLRTVDPTTVDRILILSPNHFSTGQGLFQTTRASFATPFGVVEADRTWLEPLIQEHLLLVNDEPFVGEHGVFGLLPIIAKLFPGVPVVPIITRGTTPKDDLATLAQGLVGHLDNRTLVIASLDFAHNTTNIEAQRRDTDSVQILTNLNVNTEGMNVDGRIAVDSPPTLSLFLRLMTTEQATTFTLIDHSNSALESGQLDATNVTSHITGTFRRSQ